MVLAAQDIRQHPMSALEMIAAWYREHPEVPLPEYAVLTRYNGQVRLGVQAHSKDEIAAYARAFRRATKEYAGDFFYLRADMGEVRVEVYAPRKNVCRRVVTGTRLIPESVVPESIVPTHEEEIVEWVCDEPLLVADSSGVTA